MTKKKTKRRPRRHINLVLVVGIILGFAGLVLSFGGHFVEYGMLDLDHLITDFYANAGSELISIAITIVVIDTLYQQRQRRQDKARLIREMGSGDRGVALRAVKELRAEKWFTDGTLRGAELWRTDLSLGQLWSANLEDADLRATNLRESELRNANLRNATLNHADLRGTDLLGVDFSGASLKGVQLQGSNISLEQIQSAKTLESAIMPDGSPYEAWKKQPVPVTLTKRKVELDTILAAKSTNPTAPIPDEKSESPLVPILWFGTGLVTALISQLFFEFFRKGKRE